MTDFTRAWDETDPASANNVSEGAQEIREFKTDIRERIAKEHLIGTLVTSPFGMHAWQVKSLTSADSPYTVTSQDHVLFCNTTSGAITLNFPTVVGLTGKPWKLIHKAGSNNIVIDPSGSETVNGAATLTINKLYTVVDLVSDGVDALWAFLSSDYASIYFSAYRSTNQNVSSGVWTKLQANSEVFDNGGYYDAVTNYRFQPSVAGKYFIRGQIEGYTTTGATAIGAELRKNGTAYKQAYTNKTFAAAESFAQPVTEIIDLNGSTDYVELFGFLYGTDTLQFTSGTKQSDFEGFRIGA